MRRGRYLVGIDNGSQSTKVTVFDRHGNVVCEGRQALRPYDTPRPGVAEHPDDDLWSSIGAASRRAMEAFAGDPADIAAVGLCTIRFCRALLRADGSLASPVMSWMDERVSRPHEQGDPAVRYVTTSSGYLGHRMTGRFRDTAANYAGVWPISTTRWEWLRDDEGFADFGADRELLFELVMPGEPLGTVTEDASRHTGLPAGLPVFATANDKAVEALGCGLRSRRTLVVSLGTYSTSMTAGGRDVAEGASYWTNFASVPHEYLYESTGVRRGMWTVSWWRRLLGGDPRHAAEGEGTTVEQHLDRGAAEVPAGSDGLMVVLDWLAPAGAPFRKGSILGFDVRHGRFHVHRAILEGMALTIHRHAISMGDELGERFSEIVVSGGGSNSDLLVQIFADVFGAPARRCAVPDAAGLGAAICAATGAGFYADFDEAVGEMVRSGPAFHPDGQNHDLYRKMSALYAEIPKLTDRLYADSYELFG